MKKLTTVVLLVVTFLLNLQPNNLRAEEEVNIKDIQLGTHITGKELKGPKELIGKVVVIEDWGLH